MGAVPLELIGRGKECGLFGLERLPLHVPELPLVDLAGLCQSQAGGRQARGLGGGFLGFRDNRNVGRLLRLASLNVGLGKGLGRFGLSGLNSNLFLGHTVHPASQRPLNDPQTRQLLFTETDGLLDIRKRYPSEEVENDVGQEVRIRDCGGIRHSGNPSPRKEKTCDALNHESIVTG